MSKEALHILGQIWVENEEYKNIDDCIAYVVKAFKNPVKEETRQGPNFIYKDPTASVSAHCH
jgi:hypothetical protein